MKASGRTFVVSGGSSGLGLATVQALLDSDASVAVLDLQPPADLSKLGDKVKFIKTDISETGEVEDAAKQSADWAKKTGRPLGGVINCAGVATAAKITNHSLDLWNFAVAVNLTGTFNLTRFVVKRMIEDVKPDEEDGERGIVIMVSSAAAFEGQPGQTAYAATKGAVGSMTLPMSRDLGRHGIRVVTIAPSVFKSAMTDRMPEKTVNSLKRDMVFPIRFGQPHEFAQTVDWIIKTRFVNGETIRLSGAGRMPGRL